MTDDGEAGADATGADDRAQGRRSDERARRRALVFGDVLPEGTIDDRPAAGEEAEQSGGAAQEEWLRANVPPHHGS